LPLPYIAAHVAQAEGCLAKFTHRRRVSKPIFVEIFNRKFPLPNISIIFFFGLDVIAPWIYIAAVGGVAGSVFPFDFTREALSSPFGIGVGIVP